MTRVLAAELQKVRTTRTTLVVVAAALFLALLLGAANVGAAGQGTSAALGSAAFVEDVVGLSTLPAIVAVLLGVLLAAGEHQHGTITTTFLATPRRHQVVFAKATAAAITGPAVALGMVVAALAAAMAGVVVEGATLEVDAGGVARTLLGLFLAAALLGAIGALLGLLVRSQVAAVVAVAAEALVVEGVLDVVTGGSLRRWLPGGAAAELAGASSSRPLWATGCLVLAWTAAVAAATLPAVLRRDVA